MDYLPLLLRIFHKLLVKMHAIKDHFRVKFSVVIAIAVKYSLLTPIVLKHA